MSTVLPTAVLSPREVHDQILTENPLVVDVRETAEYAAGRIPSAQIIPLANFARFPSSGSARRRSILYCQNGAAASRLASFWPFAASPTTEA